MNETPTITGMGYASSTVSPLIGNVQWGPGAEGFSLGRAAKEVKFVTDLVQQYQTTPNPMPNSNRRYVQVFIADPNENVPLEESVLFKGDQKLTDLTDTELFFEVPMADILKTFNEKRVKWTDKDASKKSGKDVFLDPVKIRDLKMVVVTIAQF